MTTIVNTKIGVSKNVSRVWLEGVKLARAGVRIGARYACVNAGALGERFELREVGEDHKGQTFTVSRRMRRNVAVPLLEVRTHLIAKLFGAVGRVRVAIRHGRIVLTASHIETRIAQRLKRLSEKLRSGEKLATGSLFHGGGVLDKALHSGMRKGGINSFVQVGVEMNPVYLDCSLRNNPELWSEESIVVCSDITELDLSRNAPQLDALYAGIPCTGASKAGRVKNKIACAEEHGSAGDLFTYYLDAVKAFNPAILVIENVVEYMNTAAMTVIRSVLKNLGYRTTEAVLNGNEFGALENRNRMVLVGVTEGMAEDFDFANVVPAQAKPATLSEILEPVELDSKRWKSFDYLAEKAIRDKAKGNDFRRQLLSGKEGFCGTVGRLYAKYRSTEPFIIHPENPDLSRIFTKGEHAAVKTIPLSVVDGESETISHEILGQSVIFAVFEAVGLALGQLLARLFPFGQAEDQGLFEYKMAA